MIDNTTRTEQAKLIAMWMKAEGITQLMIGRDNGEFQFGWEEGGFYGSIVEKVPTGDPSNGPKASEFLIHGMEVSIEHTVCGEHIMSNPWSLKEVNTTASNHVCKPEENDG